MNTTNQTFSKVTYLFDYKLKLVEQIVLASIFIAALIGNTFVLIIMINTRHRRMTRMTFFILHLTIADLLVAFFSVLPMFIWKSTITFYGGDFLCRIIAFLMLTVSYISVYTLVVMANDRYQAIVHPLSIYTWTFRTGLAHMFGVWCLSLILASPQLFIFRLAHHPAYERKTCLAKFLGPYRTWELTYIAWTIIFQFLLPICILIFCYTSVYLIINRSFSMYRTSDTCKTRSTANLPPSRKTKRLNNSPKNDKILNDHINIHYPIVECKNITRMSFANRAPAHNLRNMTYPVVYRVRRSHFDLTKNHSTLTINGLRVRQKCGANHFLSRARLKSIKLTFLVVVTYMLCSAPFYIGSIIMVLHEKFISQKIMNWLMTIFSLLFNLNSCANPIICLTLSGTLLRFHNDHSQQPSPIMQNNQIHSQQKRKRNFLEV